MNWSGKMWALQYEDGTLVEDVFRPHPYLLGTRESARLDRKFLFPAAKVVRVQVDVKVIE